MKALKRLLSWGISIIIGLSIIVNGVNPSKGKIDITTDEVSFIRGKDKVVYKREHELISGRYLVAKIEPKKSMHFDAVLLWSPINDIQIDLGRFFDAKDCNEETCLLPYHGRYHYDGIILDRENNYLRKTLDKMIKGKKFYCVSISGEWLTYNRMEFANKKVMGYLDRPILIRGLSEVPCH